MCLGWRKARTGTLGPTMPGTLMITNGLTPDASQLASDYNCDDYSKAKIRYCAAPFFLGSFPHEKKNEKSEKNFASGHFPLGY